MGHAPGTAGGVVEGLSVFVEAASVLVVLAPYPQAQPVAGRNDDARRHDLDVDLVHLSRNERLNLIVRMEGLPGFAPLRIERPVRGAQPPVGDGRIGIGRSLERDLVPVGVEETHDEEEVGVLRRRGDAQAGRHRSRDLGLLLERLGDEEQTVPHRLVGELRPIGDRGGRERQVGLKVVLGPPSPGERPLVFAPPHEALSGPPDVQLNAGGQFEAVVDPLEKVIEETLLQVSAV